MTVLVRLASPADAAQLTELRFEWSPPPAPAPADAAGDFAAHLEDWMRRQGDRYLCAMATAGEEPVGMAWLAVFERVPNARERLRLSGDVQSVYVRPGLRNQAIGERLVRLLLDEAGRRGVTEFTVHSSEGALPFYRRLGFVGSDRRLELSW
jgi:GNAT superfamily N-acetyltransferase